MSGRKSCEVVDLLERGLKARDMTNDYLNRSLNGHRGAILKNAEDLRHLQGQVNRPESLSEEAAIMFGASGKKQAEACAMLHSKILEFRISEDSAIMCDNKLRELEQEIQDCDNEAASIRRAIASKYDYCDAEYKRAGILKKRYERLAEERRQLDREMNSASSEAASILREARSEEGRFEQACKSVREMNTMAQNRKAANELKQQIEAAWKEIPQDWGQKFFAGRQSELKSKLSAMQGKPDEHILKEAPALKNEIDEFRNKLAERIAVWEREKGAAEGAMQQAENLAKSDFVDAWDHNDDPKNAKRTKLFQYIGNYEKKDYKERYESKVVEAKKAMDEERFIDAQKAYKSAGDVAREACDHALQLQERMVKKMELAASIEDVMYQLNYDTDFITIDDNPNNGFRIICKAGSEIIDFTRVDYDKDGTPIVEIDHTEPASGDCHKSWKAITVAMRQQGIPLTNVTKNGKSIISAPNTQKASEESPSGTRARG